MTKEQFFKRYIFDPAKDELGDGGFGVVYKAFDDVRDRHVAVKMCPVRRGQENFSLLNEVELANQISDHKNIAHYEACYRFNMHNGIFDCGVLQYYVAGNLSQLIKNKALSAFQKESVALGILEGIAHLHAHNIVHRDLKSTNILIAERGGGEYIPKIADFGLSKQFEDNERSYFSNSFVGGSLLYVAPEQLKGETIRKNVDLWSFGVVLYELFLGEVPFMPKGDMGTETARVEIVNKITKGEIPNRIEEIPVVWREVVRGCMTVNPLERLQSVEHVRAILAGEDVNVTDRRKLLLGQTEIDPGRVIIEQPKDKKTTLTWLKYGLGGSVLLILIWCGMEWSKRTTTKYAHLPPDIRQALESIEASMVSLPGGSFMMGCTEEQGSDCWDNEKPTRFTRVGSFRISKYEVTQNQYKAIMSYNPSYIKSCGQCPVEQVSWNDAQAFIKKVKELSGETYRLPTEEEWEYAARGGGDGKKFAGSNNVDDVAWYFDNSGYKTHEVGQKRANGFGLYDMSGNVWELTASTYGASTKVIRGGSYVLDSRSVRVSTLSNLYPFDQNSFIGFRLCKK